MPVPHKLIRDTRWSGWWLEGAAITEVFRGCNNSRGRAGFEFRWASIRYRMAMASVAVNGFPFTVTAIR